MAIPSQNRGTDRPSGGLVTGPIGICVQLEDVSRVSLHDYPIATARLV